MLVINLGLRLILESEQETERQNTPISKSLSDSTAN